MKKPRQCVLLVDTHRPKNRLRPTCGRYRVCAKTEKEAIDLLRKAIKFGDIQFYYFEKNTNPDYVLPYKTVKQEVSIYDEETDSYKGALIDVISATGSRKELKSRK